HEASSVAASVMQIGAPTGVAATHGADPATVHRAATSPGAATSAATPPLSHDISRNMSGGSPLPESVRGFMEPRFNADFGNVRVHTGESAARMSDGVNARAFAVGSHIFFGQGQFQPGSSQGKELIAHELTHVVQQGKAP